MITYMPLSSLINVRTLDMATTHKQQEGGCHRCVAVKARVGVPVTFVSTFAICEHCSIEIEFLVGVRIRWCRRSRETFRRGDTVKALLLILMLALAGVAWARSHRYIHFGALSDRDVLVASQEGTHPTVTVFDTQVNIGCTARPATVYASEG